MTRDLQGASLWSRARSVVAASVAAVTVTVPLVEAGVGEDRRVLVLVGVRRVQLAVVPELAAEVARRGPVEVEVGQEMQRMPTAGLPGHEALAAAVRLQHRNELATERRARAVGLTKHEGALRVAVALLLDDRCRLDLEITREARIRAGLLALEAGLGPHVLGVALALLDPDRVDIELAHDLGRLGLARAGDRHSGRDRAHRDRYREPPSSTHTQSPSGVDRSRRREHTGAVRGRSPWPRGSR